MECLERPEESIVFLELGVINGVSHNVGAGDCTKILCIEQQVFLNTLPSL